jgi:hypothetical protein
MIARLPKAEDGPLLRAKVQIYAATMYPEFVPDIEKIHWLVRSCTNESKTHYCRVVGAPGAPKAAILTRTQENLWAMKKNAAILLWYSDIPGMGAMLLRGFRDWVRTEKHVVAAGFSADWISMDDRPLMLADRIGFKRRGDGGFFYFPRGSKEWVSSQKF